MSHFFPGSLLDQNQLWQSFVFTGAAGGRLFLEYFRPLLSFAWLISALASLAAVWPF